MTSDQSNHDFSDELLSAYVDGELTPEESAQVAERLQTDARARQLVAEMRTLSGALKALPREKLGRDVRPQVWAAAERVGGSSVGTVELPPRDRGAGFRRGLAWSAIAIAATLALMVVQPADEQGNGRDAARAKPKSEVATDNMPRQTDGAREFRREAMPEMRAATPGDSPHVDALAPAAAPLAPAAPGASSDSSVDKPPALRDEVLAAEAANEEPSGTIAAIGVESEPAEHSELARTLGDQQASDRASDFLSILDPATLAEGKAVLSRAPAPPTVEISTNGRRGRARFDEFLAEHNISMGEDRFSAGAPVASGPEPSGGEAEAVLVEASPAQLAELYFDCVDDREAFADVRVQTVANESASGERDVEAAKEDRSKDSYAFGRYDSRRSRGLDESLSEKSVENESAPAATNGRTDLAAAGNAPRAAARSRSQPPGRAWRVPLSNGESEEFAGRQVRTEAGQRESGLGADGSQRPALASKSIGAEGGGRGGAASEKPALDRVQDAEQGRTVRVLFLIRPAHGDAPSSAPAEDR